MPMYPPITRKNVKNNIEYKTIKENKYNSSLEALSNQNMVLAINSMEDALKILGYDVADDKYFNTPRAKSPSEQISRYENTIRTSR